MSASGSFLWFQEHETSPEGSAKMKSLDSGTLLDPLTTVISPPTTHPPNNVVPQCAKSHLSNLQGYKLVCFMFKLHIYTQHQSWQTPPALTLGPSPVYTSTPVWRRRRETVGWRAPTRPLPSSVSISVSQCLVVATLGTQQPGQRGVQTTAEPAVLHPTPYNPHHHQDHLTTTAILPEQEKQARDGVSASAASRSWQCCCKNGASQLWLLSNTQSSVLFRPRPHRYRSPVHHSPA